MCSTVFQPPFHAGMDNAMICAKILQRNIFLPQYSIAPLPGGKNGFT